jgi:uncharacterized protein (TIRG00374 family)
MDELSAPSEEAIELPKGFSIRRIMPALGYTFAAAGLIWIMRDIQFNQLMGMIAHMDWRWVGLAIACDVMSYVCQGLRWRYLLKPQGDLSTMRATRAIYAGLFTNEVLPMRLGEVVRGWLASRWIASSFVAVIPSMVIERLFDGLWLAVGVGLAAMFAPLPTAVIRGAQGLGAGVVIAVAILFYLALRPRRIRAHSSTPAGVFSKLLEQASEALQGVTRTREFYLSLAASLGLLAFQAMAFWFVLLACGLDLSFWVGATVFLIVHLGTAIPNAPANVGAYQFFTVIGLTLFGVDKEAATNFSLVVFALLTAPLLLLGGAAIGSSGVTFLELSREARKLSQ